MISAYLEQEPCERQPALATPLGSYTVISVERSVPRGRLLDPEANDSCCRVPVEAMLPGRLGRGYSGRRPPLVRWKAASALRRPRSPHCAQPAPPASSGKTNRHRLNQAGDRDANRALYMIIVTRLRYCPDTQAYIQRRIAEGLTKPEAIRCVKRYVARQTYHAVRADLAATNDA